MQPPAIPLNETERLAALMRYQILDTLPEQEYDDLTHLASTICQTPIALISLIDRERQWFKSRVGIDAPETPRNISFCGHVVADATTLMVPDTTEDARFADNPLVCQEPKIRFYAGAPLTTQDGYILGTLCVIDYQPRTLTLEQLHQLQALSRLVISQLDLRLKEAQLHRSNQELVRATRLKDEFLANMSHELRTPLNTILGLTEVLREQTFGPLVSPQIEALHTIERSGAHLLDLINDILDVAKIEAGHMELDCHPVAIAPLCQSSLTFIQPQALRKQIRLQVNVPPQLPDVLVDARRIRQVLINLLSNAVKFTSEGGCITLDVSHHPVPTLANPGTLTIAIADTGVGIAPNDMEKLFQPFIQIDSALNRQFQGTGLGLTLVKQIVELHGGQVSVRSTVGTGSCFTIELPCTLPPQGTLETLAKRSEGIATASPSPHRLPDLATNPSPLILLAENHEANVSTITNYLEARGYRLLLAQDRQTTLELAQTQQPDLILLDIQVPGVGGLDTMKQIRQSPGLTRVPIMVLTDRVIGGDRDRYLEAGANEYLAKPIRLKELARTIEHLLNIHNPV